MKTRLGKQVVGLLSILAMAFANSSNDALGAGPRGSFLRIDFGAATDRKDTVAKGWTEWQVPEGPSATRNFNGIRITLRAGDGAAVAGDWIKLGLDTDAVMATDGVILKPTGANQSAVLELVLEGLAPGRHSLVTYHNWFKGGAGGSLDVAIVDQNTKDEVQPSARVLEDVDVATAYLEFDAKADKPVVVRVASATNGNAPVILNGLELDAPNPKLKALRPSPANDDEHVDASSGVVALKWRPAASAVKHELYAASNADPATAWEAVADAERDAKDVYRGEVSTASAELEVPPNNSLLTHAWRIDSIDAAGKVTRGDVWAFRARHIAFPGAEGYGRFALGGRGGRVIKVTNLESSGPGSLGAALAANEPRTIVFDVSGRIDLKTRIGIRNPYVTVAGQTAPGKGICISNYNFGMLGAHDVVIRDIRVRPGDTAGVTLDGMGMASSDNCIIDHCSISWTQDESFSSRQARNITLQRTLISEALNVAGHKNYAPGTQHGYAASIGGDVGSFHHNLLANCAGRNWSLAGGLTKSGAHHAGRLDLRNNVVYNWGHRTTDGGAAQVNFVNNYYKPGPASHVFHVLMSERENVAAFGPQNYYEVGNVMEGHYTADQLHAGFIAKPTGPIDSFSVNEPFFESYVTTQSAAEAFDNVLADVGCNRPMLDDHDRRIIDETRNGTTTYKGSVSGLPGLPDSQKDVGGWEDYPEIHRPADWDTDNDGLPNAWETAHGLNPNSAAGDFADANADPDGDGYTNLEDYLNELAAPAK